MEIWNKIWRDKNGHLLVWQWPNFYLYGWVIFAVGSLLTSGRLSNILAGIGAVILVAWSILEIWKGANYFRRLLGLLVLVYAIVTFVKIFK